jgi:virginiamycin B lyase
MRRLVPTAFLIAVLCLAAPAGSATAALKTASVKEGAEAQALAAGADGKLWVAGVDHSAGTSHNFVAFISPSGEYKSFAPATAAGTAGIGDLTRGPGGMWFSVPAADQVKRIDPSGNAVTIQLPVGSRPTGLAVTSGGLVWATLEGTARIAQIAPLLANVTDWNLEPETRPTAMVLGSDNALWALEAGSATVVRVGLEGSHGSYPLATGNANSAAAVNGDIAAGADGSIWVGQAERGTIAKLVPAPGSANYSGFAVPGGPTTLLSPGPGGDIWFADQAGKIGSIAPDGEVGELACAIRRCSSKVQALTRGPEGKLWFAAGDTIAPFEPQPFTLRVPNASGRVGRGGIFMRIRCRGGAAGQRCPGRIELRHGGRRIQRSPYRPLTGSFNEVTLPLSRRAKELLAAQGQLRVVLALSVAGKTTDRREFTLRAAR